MSLFPVEMTTDRLRFERVHPDDTDVAEVYEHAGHHADRIDDVTRFLTWDPHETPKDSAEFVEFAGEQFEANEGAHYVVRPRDGESDAGTFAGTAGIGVEWDRRLATLGIWLRPDVWGRGYSGERAARFMRLAFETLDLAAVAVEHDADNEKSAAAIERYVERFGGRREGTIRNGGVRQDGSVYDAVRYSVSRDEWADSRD